MGWLGDALKTAISATSPIGAIATLGSSLISGISGNQAQKSANKTNMQIAEQNNQTQRDIAAANNQLQVDMMRENNKFSRDMAIEMFNLENNYNSPVEQVKRLQEAGINPAVYFANANGSAGTGDIATPSAAGSTVSPQLPGMVTPNIQAAPPVVTGAIDAMAQLINMSLAAKQAEKAGAETQSIWKQIDLYMRQIENQDIQNEWNKFRMGLDKENLPRKQEQEIQQLMSSVFKNYAEGGEATALMELHDIQKKLDSEEYDILREKHPYIVQEAQQLVKLRIAQIETEKSAQEKNRAQAAEAFSITALNNEERKRLEDSHDSFVQLEKLRAGGAALDYAKAAQTFNTYIDILEQDKILSEEQANQAREMTRKMKADNSVYWFDKVFGYVERTSSQVQGFMPWAFGRSYSQETYDMNGNVYETRGRSKGR